MSFLIRHTRSLYLLALLHVLGGPLMLGCMVLVTQAVRERESLRMDAGPGFSWEASSGCIREGCTEGEWTWRRGDGLLPPGSQKAPTPAKTKDAKSPSWLLVQSEVFKGFFVSSWKMTWRRWHDPVPSRLANAPPLPPPRCG